MTDTFDTPKSKCPICGAALDAATDYTAIDQEDPHRPPRAGDICVCGYCAEVLEFCADGTLIQATIKNLMSLKKKDHAMLDKTQDWIRKTRPKDEKTKTT